METMLKFSMIAVIVLVTGIVASNGFLGNMATVSGTVANPSISITSPTHNAQVNNNHLTIQGTSSDSGSGVQQVEVSIDGGAYTSATGTTSWSYTPSAALSAGSHTVTAQATNNAGKVATTSSITFTVDTTAPAVVITSPSNNTQVSNSKPVIKGTSSDSGSGVQQVEVSIDGGPYTSTGATSWSYTPSAALSVGSHTVTARVTDKAGNVSTTLVMITVDTTAPEVAITSPANNAQVNNTQPTIQGTSSDSGSGVQKVQIKIDSNGYTSATGTTSWSYTPSAALSSSGSHKITVKATDNAGNVATTSIKFTVDTKAPKITMTSPANNAQVSNQPTIQGTSFDSVSGAQQVQVSIDGGPYTSATGTTSWSYTPSAALSAGSHTVTARVTDKAGNISIASTITIIVDATAPTVAITSPTNNAQVNNNQLTIQGTSSDSGSGVQQVEVSIDGGAYTSATGATSWSYTLSTKLSSAPHIVIARATDNAGNVATTSSITFKVYITAPSAPLNLLATGSSAQVSLTWQQAPSSNGGDAITNYKIYRSLASGGEILLTTVGNVTSYSNTGLTNGVTYYYKVSAVNSVGESPLSKEASASPTLVPVRSKIIISLIRSDLDPASLANVASYTKSFSKPTDSVFDGGIAGYTPNWKLDATIPGQMMIGGGSNQSISNFQSNWQNAKTKNEVNAVFFDEEPTLSMTHITTGYTTAHSLGLKFVTTPTYGEISSDPSVITTLAQNSDIINFQINPEGGYKGSDKGMTYAQVVQKYELAARQANPNILIFVQLNAGTSTDHTNTGTMTDQINAFNSVKSYVDGVFVYYYSTPDPTPILKLFYNGIGIFTG